MRKQFIMAMKARIFTGILCLIFSVVFTYWYAETPGNLVLLAVMIFSIAFTIYLLLGAYPYYSDLNNLLDHSEPVHMYLVPKLRIKRNNFTDSDFCIQLYLEKNSLDSEYDIYIDQLANARGIQEIKPYTKVRVYGVDRKRGPVVIETDKGYMWPGSSGAIMRKGQWIAY